MQSEGRKVDIQKFIPGAPIRGDSPHSRLALQSVPHCDTWVIRERNDATAVIVVSFGVLQTEEVIPNEQWLTDSASFGRRREISKTFYIDSRDDEFCVLLPLRRDPYCLAHPWPPWFGLIPERNVNRRGSAGK